MINVGSFTRVQKRSHPTAWRDFAGQLTPDQRARFERMDTAGVPDADAALAAAMLELALELGGLR